VDTWDATELAARLRAGELSAPEAIAASIDRIDARNPAVNAVVVPLYDHGCAAGERPPGGPFAGVPILLKDLGACLGGLPLYQGNQLLRRLDWRAPADAPLARRLVDAGFVVIGKTNTPEFGAGVDTQPSSFGPTRNPWDRAYSVSGSSGGAAAAVAAGMVPLAHGSDFGGSIRAPAAWCGVIGLKPSKGRVSTHPAPPGPNSEFVLTRSLRDAAAVLDAVADPQSPADLRRPPPGGWLAAARRSPASMRIGLLTAVDGVDTDATGARRAEAAATVLADAGHEIVALDGSFLADADWDRMQLRLRANGARARLSVLRDLAGRDLDATDAEPMMLALAALAPGFTDGEYAEASAWQLGYARELGRRWTAAGVDAVVTPTTGIDPRRLTDLAPPADDPLRVYELYRRIGCFLGCWNLAGHAAISLPWWTPGIDRLPAGVQLVAAPGEEDRLLQLAHQLCEARPDLTEVRIADVSEVGGSRPG
jgi:amidase